MKYKDYAQHIGADDFVIKWVETTLARHLEKNNPSTEEVEHILDYLVQSGKKVSKMSYSQAHKLAEAWTKAQMEKGEHIKEVEGDMKVA